MTPLERKVLQAAVEDGGVVELTGLDKHPRANGHWINAAHRLFALGYVRPGWAGAHAIPLHATAWEITEAGRQALTR